MLPRITSRIATRAAAQLTTKNPHRCLSPTLNCPYKLNSYRTFPVKSHKPKHPEPGKKENFIKFFGVALLAVGGLLLWTDDHYDDYLEEEAAKLASKKDSELLAQERKDEEEWREREEGNA
ncbi:hypothetical protein TrVE_jg13914 [Triparma verrucosa]|uniref:Uncharacterized protein n=2 Tax=Triparma TaxID=722752 RepID=A0A9W7AQ81_9STRA|nr:hypothetical protein TrST_g13258 [Triparma strigata]GMH81453.1 hypothetical protein TrVE_jg13914 [Triparma verrucosa]